MEEPGEPLARPGPPAGLDRETDPRLHRAYLLKEGLQHVFAVKGAAGIEALDRWQSWAARSRIPAFVALIDRDVLSRAGLHCHSLGRPSVEAAAP